MEGLSLLLCTDRISIVVGKYELRESKIVLMEAWI